VRDDDVLRANSVSGYLNNAHSLLGRKMIFR
jgi:hypothetical protein